MSLLKGFGLVFVAFALGACASGTLKERQVARDRAAASSGHFCDFVSGEVYPDVEVEVNLRAAKRCESSVPLSLTQFRNSSNHNGILFCCKHNGESQPAPKPARPAKGPASEEVQ
ncbi:MAG: hypothetical protein ACLGGX_04410 [Bdellovibrionia bacterium]